MVEAEQLIKTTYELMKENLKMDHLYLLRAEHIISSLYLKQSKFDDALTIMGL
jgi:hypothetical protein